MRQLIIIIFLSLTINGCAIVGLYPSHEGRVVDLSTKEPIRGAAVLAIYNTSGLDHTEREDAIEIVTDKNGHFKIPWNLIFTFRFLGGWDDSPQIFIYKPGYGCFPRYIKEKVIRDSDGSELRGDLPAGIPVTIELDKLTPEELKWKSSCFTHGVPYEKMREMQKLEHEDGVNRGLYDNQHAYLFNSQPDLYMAISYDDYKSAKRLVETGNINVGPYTPLMYAAELGHFDIAELLISKGAFIDAQDNEGNTALLIAQLWHGRKRTNDITKMLINHNADINRGNRVGSRPLSRAVSYCSSDSDYYEIVKLLLQKGAKIDIDGDHGRSLLKSASREKSGKLAELLRSYGARD